MRHHRWRLLLKSGKPINIHRPCCPSWPSRPHRKTIGVISAVACDFRNDAGCPHAVRYQQAVTSARPIRASKSRWERHVERCFEASVVVIKPRMYFENIMLRKSTHGIINNVGIRFNIDYDSAKRGGWRQGYKHAHDCLWNISNMHTADDIDAGNRPAIIWARRGLQSYSRASYLS